MQPARVKKNIKKPATPTRTTHTIKTVPVADLTPAQVPVSRQLAPSERVVVWGKRSSV